MNKETIQKNYMIASFLIAGSLIFLDGFGVIHLNDNPNNSPQWVITIVGMIFILASVMVYIGDKGKINDVFASIVTALMGLVFGWVALFGSSGFSSGLSNGGALVETTEGGSLARIMFGIFSLLFFLVSLYALRLSLKGSPNK